MLLTTLLMLQTPTLGEALRLPPDAAGDRLLAGRDHRPIEAIAMVASRGLAPPGVEELHLVERAVTAAGDGCVRRRWIASFRRAPNGERDDATISGVYASDEVALAHAGACSGAAPFIHVNPGLDPADAIHGLRQFDRIVSTRSNAAIACSDDTRSGLCDGGDDAVRRKLRTLTPWAISRQGDDTVFWLSTQGGTVTVVRFARRSPGRIFVDRRVPAPF